MKEGGRREEIMWPVMGVGVSQIGIHLAKAWSRHGERVVAECGAVVQ